MRDVFVATENVVKFEEALAELVDRGGRGPSMLTVTAQAGRGKTEAAKRHAAQSEAIYLAPQIVRTPFMLLRDICFELAKVRPGSSDRCLRLISTEMGKKRRALIVDEADLLSLRHLEMLRNLGENELIPVVLIGEDALNATVEQRRRLFSRLFRRIEFGEVRQADVALFFEKSLELKIDAPTAKLLAEHGGGDWRPLYKAAQDIEQAMIASGADRLTYDLAKKVLGHGA